MNHCVSDSHCERMKEHEGCNRFKFASIFNVAYLCVKNRKNTTKILVGQNIYLFSFVRIVLFLLLALCNISYSDKSLNMPFWFED